MDSPEDRTEEGLPERQQGGGYRPGSPTSRAVSVLLSALIMVLAGLLAFFVQQNLSPPQPESRPLATFDVAAGNRDAAKQQSSSANRQRQPTPDRTQKPQREVARAPVPSPEPKQTQEPAFTFLKMSSRDFAAADIGAMKPSAGGGAVAGGNAKGTYGPGEGPGGAILYNADWFRRPTDAQLGGYLPPSSPQYGWGMIACQTIEHYKVENCQILDESPRGSGFARAVLNAAWQFQVIPPRVNGKQQIGSWVRIRIEYGSKGAAGDG
ncbi:hypothetical protein [Novosphingobium colocasiae]|uniref:Protein TonB n=1 Tax=Novosphingobium colocasiae TaxID=1256513 RepID=A0A918PLL3_9SPHN|nr:hypothetical protein [Novosphingobium colocasiae]GGZ13869.1 hypothetical protein GCM10011614_31170 [Novosphingobium colocasiae]